MSDIPPIDKYHDCHVFGYFKRIRRAIAFAAFPYRSWNRICDILENISGVGCRIEKQSKENTHWIINVDPSENDLWFLCALFSVHVFDDGRIGIYLPGGFSSSSWVRFNGMDTTATGLPSTPIDINNYPGWYSISSGRWCVRVTFPSQINGTARWSLVHVSSNNPAGDGDDARYVEIPIAIVKSSDSSSSSSSSGDDDLASDRQVQQFHVGCINVTHLEFTKCGESSDSSDTSDSSDSSDSGSSGNSGVPVIDGPPIYA